MRSLFAIKLLRFIKQIFNARLCIINSFTKQNLFMSNTSPRKSLVYHDKYNDKCVCEICTCGSHRCPKGQAIKFEGQTTNQEYYKAYKIENNPETSPAYKINQRKYDPEALQTSYKLQYTPKKGQRFQGNKQVVYVPKKTKFYSQTEYKSKYLKTDINHQPEIKYQYKPNKAKFEGITSYTAEFQPKPIQQNYIQPEVQYERKKIPFVGESSYKQQFKEYKISPQKKQTYNYSPNKTRFGGQSHYKSNFPQYDRTNYLQQKCPVVELPSYPRQCSPGKQHLHYSAQKRSWN